MTTLCNKLGEQIKSFDQFAVPVQLNYRGNTSFNTVLGGCISMLLGLALSITFFVQLESLFYHPEFLSTPTEYDFNSKSAQLTP